MVEILYCLEYPFMRKTFAAINRHLEADSAYVPLRPAARNCWASVRQIPPDSWTVDAIDAAVASVDPAVIVANSRFRPGDLAFRADYPLVHVRHGSSVGRGEWETIAELDGVLDVALAPGEYWRRRYREIVTDDVATPVVGIPEADHLVDAPPPDERRVLYAPTNHNYGGGSYLETADQVLDVIADSSFELQFRPHPHDRSEEPGKSVTERCKARIADLPNVTFDDEPTPQASMRDAAILVSDYSGIVTEWLHTGRPLVQCTGVASGDSVPQLGYTTDRLTSELLARLLEDGYPAAVERAVERRRSQLGIPMDGHAGERAAQEVMACTP